MRVEGELIPDAGSHHSAIQEGVLLGFVAGFGGLVTHSETNPNLLEEVVRWGASCENPDEVVRNLLQLPTDFQQHRLGLISVGMELNRTLTLPERIHCSMR